MCRQAGRESHNIHTNRLLWCIDQFTMCNRSKWSKVQIGSRSRAGRVRYSINKVADSLAVTLFAECTRSLLASRFRKATHF